jgi:polar amino acid transport system substrate-binding protein
MLAATTRAPAIAAEQHKRMAPTIAWALRGDSMKKYAILTAAFLAVLLAAACTQSGTAASGSAMAGLPDLQGRVIKAVTENNYLPLNFADPKTGQGIGWEYDAMGEIAKRLNAKIEWSLCSWDTMIQAVRDGQFDIGMDGITINDERRKQVDFSDAYMSSQQYMLVKKDEIRFTDEKTFAADPKLLIGAQAGTTNFYTAVYNVLDGDEKNPRIKLFDTFGATVQALLAGDVDMVLMDATSTQGYIGANPDKLKQVGGPLGNEEFGFILKPGSDLTAAVNAALKSMKEDGTLAKLDTKWLYEYQAQAAKK